MPQMHSKGTKCIKVVGDTVCCTYCHGNSIKYGKNGIGTQRYQCKDCRKVFLSSYINQAYVLGTNDSIAEHIKEGCGIRSIARLLRISTTTVLKRIIHIAKGIVRPFTLLRKEYELDELCTYVKKKTNLIWLVYAIRRDNREVADFTIGNRTNKTLQCVTDTLLLSQAAARCLQ